ncbi:MAG: 50S ribosomal protein L19 [Candidatus Delongbacteria bacterium]|nr:50S ribosomal protein L19 [Candidatus Delongbacteria bacterium]
MDFINTLNLEQIRDDIPNFHSGDTLDVYMKIVEGTKERIQLFTGTVIQVRGTGVGKTFTIRKISNGIGVERIIPLNSPQIEKIVRVKEGKVRRSRIFYFRQRRGKSARIQEARKGR